MTTPASGASAPLIILTADHTLMAGYRLLFDGMLAGSQTTALPPAVGARLLMPRGKSLGIRAVTAPLGLRRIEAALIAGGFSTDDVAVVHPDNLGAAIGKETRIVAVSSGEPLGLGMNSSTMAGIAGGSIYPQAMFRRTIRRIRQAIAATGASARIVTGGPGAWQLAASPEARRDLGIHHVVTGYAEGNVAEIFKTICDGGQSDEVIAGEPVPAAGIPTIRGATTMGAVEISRGCGLACRFCTIARVPMIHLPAESILADIKTNLAGGIRCQAILSEDLFRYGASGVTPAPEALIALLRQIRDIDGIGLIQSDHANIISIAQYSDDQLQTVRKLLVGDTGCDFPWVNVGVESASETLMRTNGCTPKMGSLAGNWPNACREQVHRLAKAGFFPLVSLMIGLPGETPDDIRQTLEWVQSLGDARLAIFPMLHAPIDTANTPAVRDLSKLHWKLVRQCYRFNFKWMPRMYWDNQKAAGVGLPKRLFMQCLGTGQILQWRALFAWHNMRASE